MKIKTLRSKVSKATLLASLPTLVAVLAAPRKW
jgi:hypothetical protein